MMSCRQQQAAARLQEQSLDAFVVFSTPNLRYLCGFTGTDGVLAVTADGCHFFTDSRYTLQARRQVTAREIHQHASKMDGVTQWLLARGARRVGFEAEALTVAQLRQLEEKTAPQVTWLPLSADLRRLRLYKDAQELAWLEQAAAINEKAFEAVVPLLRPGVTEREIALELEVALRRLGGEDKAFDLIVASGERGALPHGVASDRPLREGELITLDFGTRWQGYHSDETVTVALGEVPPRLRDIYDCVLDAHDRAMDAIRPGVPLKELDAIARDLIALRGYGEAFGHGLGHGVGLEIHEAPVVSQRSEDVAAPNMVFTVEPGIYLEGIGGVRIEDTVVVTETGSRRLTRIPKSFRILPA